ncbi:MAG: domain S-box protein [Proteobacteria bacterium]|nr:domain S-box protein [Pseudomonadota bacterium]
MNGEMRNYRQSSTPSTPRERPAPSIPSTAHPCPPDEGTIAPANFVLDPSDGGRFIHVSEGVCQLFGRSRDELLQWRLADWTPGISRQRLHDLWEELRRFKSAALQFPQGTGVQTSPVAVNFEHFEFAGREQVAGHFQPTPGTCPGQASAPTLHETESHCLDGCEVLLSQLHAFDVRADALAASCSVRGRLSLVECALDQVPDAVYLADEQGNVRYANQSSCRERGYSREAFLNLSVADIDPDLGREGWARFQHQLSEMGLSTLETQHRTHDGSILNVEISASHFLYEGSGYVLFVARDIGERKRLETRLNDSERLHRTLMENLPDLIVRLDTECRHLYISPAALARFNQPMEFFLGRTICEIGWLGYENDLALLESAQEAVATATPNRLEFNLKGEVFLEIRHIPELDENGKVVSVIGTARDITESRRRQQQEEKRHSIFMAMALGAGLTETLNRVVRYLESITSGIRARIMLVADNGSRLVSGSAPGFPDDFNGAMADLAIDGGAGSCSAAVRYGRTAVAADIATHPDWRHCREPALDAGFRACWSEPIFDAQGQVLGAFGIYRTIPGAPAAAELEAVRKACHLAAIAIGRHRLQQERDAREQQFRALADNAPAVIIRYDRQCRRVYFNKELEKIAGLSAQQALGRAPVEFPGVLAPIASFYQEQIGAVLKTGEPGEVEREWTFPDGRDRCFVLRFVPERDSLGQIASVLMVGHDITERRLAERALQASERQFRSLVENSPDFIARYNREGRRLYVNPAMQEVLEWPSDSVLGRSPLDGSALTSPQQFMDAMRKVISTGSPTTIEGGCRFRGGRVGWGHIWFVPEKDEDGLVVGVLAVGRDTTELVESRKELAASRALLRDLQARSEAAREEERKRISRELHDELGQLLTTLRLNISLLRMRYGGENQDIDQAAAECIGVVDTSIKAVRGIASALRPVALDMGLAAAIKWQLDQFVEHAGVAGELNISPDGIAPTESQSLLIFRILQESLTNIVRHAQARRVRVTLKRQGDAYLLIVSDDGLGFDMSIPPRAGALGILGMRERALAAGGVLTVASVVGIGTELILSVPVEEGGMP